ncbi:MAG TPA: glycoside hydrolase family 2 TIM barrel-domain containing protein [Bacteroidota bacterium]|nr:glycoside hydrolase family 2 TIM barrel-domain containing protein [Bacteroidota bacterium]
MNGTRLVRSLAFGFALVQSVVLAQPTLLDPTLSLARIDGITVAYQNGMPVPSFEKQLRTTVPLNGVWKKSRFVANNVVTLYTRSVSGVTLLTSEAAGRQLPEFDDSGWDLKVLPGVENKMNASGTPPEYYQSGVWYRRSFTVADTLRMKQARLNFYAVNYVCDVWLNGTYLGYHEGGYTPFAFDVSKVLRYDSANVIAVRVDNVPWSKNGRKDIVPYYTCDWFNYTGIIHDVYLEFSNSVSVVRADVVPKSIDGQIKATTVVRNALAAGANVDITVRVYTAKTDSVSLTKEITADLIGDPVTINGTAQKTISIPAESVGVWQTTITIPNPRLWSPAKPNLYILKVTVAQANSGLVVDEFATQFGVRTVKTSGSKFLLNEKPAFLHGIARHEDHPVYGRSVPPQVIFSDLSAIKSMHANYIRTGHYPNHPYTYLVADRLGLAIMEEIPVWWFDDATAWDIQNTKRHIHQQMFREMVFRDYNRPSIAVWSTSNECLDVPGRSTFIRTVRDELNASYPDGRFVSQSAAADRPGAADPSQTECDVRGWTMYFGIFHGSTYFTGTKQFLTDAVAADASKPIINTEYGYWSGEGGGSSAEQATTFDSTYAALSLYAPIDQNGTARTSGPLMAITWWCAFDWYTHQQTTGYQSMGLMKMDRTTAKPVWAKLTEAYKKLDGNDEYITAVHSDERAEAPRSFTLGQNYPNPFNPTTVIHFRVPETASVTLTVSDVLGRDIETIVRGQYAAGAYTAEWNSAGHPSGTYFYTLRAGAFVETKKMILIR